MGIVNATQDSFSDAGRYTDPESRVALAQELVADGARILDIGGESASPATPTVAAAQEIAAVVPVIEAVRAGSDVLISVDTYKPAVARAAVAAGASIVNDISGLGDPELATVCAETGAAYVLMHNRGRPKARLLEDTLYPAGVAADLERFFTERLELAARLGLPAEQVILDPGPDFSKTPAQTVAVLRALDSLHTFGRPLLLPLSRKDFIGAITGRPPRQRLPGTLAALDHAVTHGGHIFRLHDIRAAREFLAARAALMVQPPAATP
jgi:dihydropteroate synthase